MLDIELEMKNQLQKNIDYTQEMNYIAIANSVLLFVFLFFSNPYTTFQTAMILLFMFFLYFSSWTAITLTEQRTKKIEHYLHETKKQMGIIYDSTEVK